MEEIKNSTVSLLPFLEYAVKIDAPVIIVVGAASYHGNAEKIDLCDGWIRLLDAVDTNWIVLTKIEVVTFERTTNIDKLIKVLKSSPRPVKTTKLAFTDILTDLVDKAISIQVHGEVFDGILSFYDRRRGIIMLTDTTGYHIINQRSIDVVYN